MNHHKYRNISKKIRYRGGSDSDGTDLESANAFSKDERRAKRIKFGRTMIWKYKKTMIRALMYFMISLILYERVASVGKNWKASKVFYVENKDRVRSKETLLTNEANVILENEFLKHKHKLDRMDEYVDIDMCVGVVTNFERENLVNVTLASLLAALKEDEKDQKHRKLRKRIYVFHDNEEFSKDHRHVRAYPFATHQSVYGHSVKKKEQESELLRLLKKETLTADERDFIVRGFLNPSKRHKMVADEFLDRQRLTYAESLQQCLDTYAEYVLIVEDDVFVSPTMFSDLREHRAYETLSTDRKNVLTHLFVSEIVDNDWNPGDIMGITVTSSVFLLSWWILWRVLSSVSIYHSKKRRIIVSVTTEILHVFFFSIACYTLLCAKYLRRPYLFPKIIQVRDRGYPNAVANLYDSSRLRDIGLVEYLRSPQSMSRPVDLAINDFTMELDMHQRIFYPNPVQHMGCRSTYVMFIYVYLTCILSCLSLSLSLTLPGTRSPCLSLSLSLTLPDTFPVSHSP